jgi:hypothetical protein
MEIPFVLKKFNARMIPYCASKVTFYGMTKTQSAKEINDPWHFRFFLSFLEMCHNEGR